MAAANRGSTDGVTAVDVARWTHLRWAAAGPSLQSDGSMIQRLRFYERTNRRKEGGGGGGVMSESNRRNRCAAAASQDPPCRPRAASSPGPRASMAGAESCESRHGGESPPMAGSFGPPQACRTVVKPADALENALARWRSRVHAVIGDCLTFRAERGRRCDLALPALIAPPSLPPERAGRACSRWLLDFRFMANLLAINSSAQAK